MVNICTISIATFMVVVVIVVVTNNWLDREYWQLESITISVSVSDSVSLFLVSQLITYYSHRYLPMVYLMTVVFIVFIVTSVTSVVIKPKLSLCSTTNIILIPIAQFNQLLP